MKVVFDTNARIAGIGIVPWTRLGPERWLKDYRIASFYGWDMRNTPGAPSVVALEDTVTELPELKLNTPTLLNNPDFRNMLITKLAGYSFMTYKPVEPPQELLEAGCTFLLMDQALAQSLENKATFRELFGSSLPLPPYQILEREIVRSDTEGFEKLMSGRKAVVVQDEQLSGGRGTYIVRERADLERALTAFKNLDSGTRLVVSDLIEGARERSVQCVVTKYGVFVGPLQKQIVRHPLLANMRVAEGDRFCGGEISRDDPLMSVYPEIRSYGEQIGAKLKEMGYKGIFGLDCLVDESGKVYILEINPRLTGMTPLLTMLYRDGQDIPFYLLHLLELANIEYTIEDDYIDPNPPEGSLLIMHSQDPGPVLITEAPESGAYDVNGTFIKKEYRLNVGAEDTQLLIQRYTPPNFKTKPGGRLGTIFVNKPVLDQADELQPEIAQFVTKMIDRTKLKEIA